MRKICQGNSFVLGHELLLLFFLLLICDADGWPSLWTLHNKQKTAAAAGLDHPPSAAKLTIGAVFEIAGEPSSTAADEEGLSKTLLMKQVHSMAISSSAKEGNCWQKAYRKLLSSCSQIIEDEEKKSRLALEFTDCFLRMSGWPPLAPCPYTSFVQFCIENFDEHTHDIYLAFFVETATMCYHLQSEAFRKETADVVNDLKQTGDQMVDKFKEVKGLSEGILNNALSHSYRLHEKLAEVETLSESLLLQELHFESQLKKGIATVQHVYDTYDIVTDQQKELQQCYHDMHQAVNTYMQKLQDAAVNSHQHLDTLSKGYKQLAQQKVQLTDSLLDKLEHLKDRVHQSLTEFKDSQTLAVEETRASLEVLTDGAQEAQERFHLWRTELDDALGLHLKSYHAILQAQEAFGMKHGSVLSTLDRMFSLFKSTLYESRALKMLIFYLMSLLFVCIFTNAKQTHDARVYLYPGLCISVAIELCIMKAYGNDQQWILTCFHWTRTIFGIFTATVILYCMATYRDLSSQTRVLLLRLEQKLSKFSNHLDQACCYVNDGHNSVENHEDDDHYSRPFYLPFIRTTKFLRQVLASKVIYHARKFVQGHCFDSSTWMHEMGEGSSEDEDDPDYQCSEPYLNEDSHNSYNLRSSCTQRTKCRFQRPGRFHQRMDSRYKR